MKVLPPSDILEKISGLEESLKENRKAGRLGTGGLVVAIAQIAVAIPASFENGLEGTTALMFGLGALVFALSIVVVAKSRLWLRESSEPFKYTCSLVEFRALGEVAGKGFSEIPVWMKYDLAEMLNERIGRLSFSDETRPENEPSVESRGEHIKISGEFLVRRKADGSWVLEVTPRVQVGGGDAAATLGHPVHFVLPEVEAPPADGGDLLHTSAEGASAEAGARSERALTRGDGSERALPTLSESHYERIVERVYFSVATQIYRQIQKDVKRKIQLLPTRFLKATAYFHEARDYERSNTMDALDAARLLYQSAMQLYDPRLRPLPERKWRRPYLLFLRRKAAVLQGVRTGCARLWPRLARAEVMAARSEIGYADTLLYRRTLAGLSGHRMNSVYEARPVVSRAMKRLERIPIEVPGCREARFDAWVTYALACYQLELTREATRALTEARSLIPNRFDDDARYLYVAGVLEPRARFAIRLLRQAVERQPRFEMAQFELVQRMEMMWRTRPTLERSVAEMIKREYVAVLKLNPGNLRAWGNLAYVHWLLGDLDDAAEAYERGREYKQMKRDATVAALDYGLARVAAEQGRCEDAYRHYLNASSAQVIQGVSDSRWTSAQYYFFDFIGDAIMDRYVVYFARATSRCGSLDDGSNSGESDRFRQIVRSFVHNDYGEACHTYHIRNCSAEALVEARKQYEEAKRLNPDAMLPHYNLHLLSKYQGDSTAAIEELQRLQKLEPLWTDGILAWEAARTEAACGKIPAPPRSSEGHEPTSESDELEREARMRLLLPHDWLWRAEGEHMRFNWRAAYRSDLRQAMRWEREFDDLHVRAIFLLVLNELNDEHRLGRADPAPSIKARHPVRWIVGDLQPEARAFLARIREHFWPGNFDVLLESYRLDPETKAFDVKEDMRETMRWWLETDPTSYWALVQLFTDFEDRQGNRLELFNDRDRLKYLDTAKETLPEECELRRWIEEKETTLVGAGTA